MSLNIYSSAHLLLTCRVLQKCRNWRHCIANEDGCVFVIDPVSKSRFTGLYDKDGKKIYQGMKVLCFNVGPHDVIFKNGAWGYRPYMSDLNWFISFAGNSNFKWENSQSKHIAIIED